MAKEIVDNTGTSVATSGEIPRDITEMVKSTLNGIGGNVIYIPYEPEFMTNTAGTGYSDFADKILPQVVLSGGITEFDMSVGKMSSEKFSDLEEYISKCSSEKRFEEILHLLEPIERRVKKIIPNDIQDILGNAEKTKPKR